MVVEGRIEGVTGWSIGESRLSAGTQTAVDNNADVQSLYQKLENVILPMFYKDRTKTSVGDAARNRHQRVVLQYAAHGGMAMTPTLDRQVELLLKILMGFRAGGFRRRAACRTFLAI